MRECCLILPSLSYMCSRTILQFFFWLDHTLESFVQHFSMMYTCNIQCGWRVGENFNGYFYKMYPLSAEDSSHLVTQMLQLNSEMSYLNIKLCHNQIFVSNCIPIFFEMACRPTASTKKLEEKGGLSGQGKPLTMMWFTWSFKKTKLHSFYIYMKNQLGEFDRPLRL